MLTDILRKRRIAIIKAFFGFGKTYSLINYLRYASSNPRIQHITIASEPLRKLRDSVARTLNAYGSTLKAHDEICDSLAKRVLKYNAVYRDNRIAYLKALSEHLKLDKCIYKLHVNSVISNAINSKILITTHKLVPLASMILRYIYKAPIKIIADEAEDYIIAVSDPLYKDDIVSIASIDPSIMKIVKRYYMEYPHTPNRLYIKPIFVLDFLKSIHLSATPPLTIYQSAEMMIKRSIDMFNIHGYDRDKDTIVFSPNTLVASYNTLSDKVIDAIKRICRRAVSVYGVCAIVSRSHEFTRYIRRIFERNGLIVTDDAKDTSPIETADIFILTVGGKFYRGVSLFSRKINSSEFPVIVSLFQGTPPKMPHAIFELIRDIERFREYANELIYAKNLQSVYRFNRNSDRSHILVFLDKRLYESLYYFFPYPYNVVPSSSLEGIAREALNLI